MGTTNGDLETAVRELAELRQLNTILTDTVRQILDSDVSLPEIGLTVLDASIKLSGSRSGALTIGNETDVCVVDPYHVQEILPGTFADLLNRIEADSHLMTLRRTGRIDGAYYLNTAVTFGTGKSGPASIRNMLYVPARYRTVVQGQILLINNSDSYRARDLENLEIIAEVFSLALAGGKVNDDLRMAKERAEREAEAKSRFLAGVSHEIRSPLNGVLLMSSMLKDSELSAAQQELVGVVMYSAKAIDRLIRDLTDITQINTGKLTIIREDFNLEDLCRNLVETNRPAALRKGLRLEYTVAGDSVHFTGDRERIGQIIGNLLSNAIKYTERGRVNLKTSRNNSVLRIVVSDTGMGIPPEMQETVFDVFNQGVRSGRKPEDGVGIGLSLVRELCELMGGQILLSSEPDRGSVFTVELPAGPVPMSGTEPSLPDSARILIVEDEGVNRLYVRTLLERDGWVIDEAVNGMEAVALVKNNHYNLVLMDISMPRMGGLEASSLIRATNPTLPIIAITANAYEEDRHRILKAGLNDIVLKPVNEKALRQSMKRCLRS